MLNTSNAQHDKCWQNPPTPQSRGRKSAGIHGIAWEILEFNGLKAQFCAFLRTPSDHCGHNGALGPLACFDFKKMGQGLRSRAGL
jgi:hypothetical protein